MPIEFKIHNGEYEAAFPGEPSYTEDGSNSPTSIERVNNAEDADEDVFRRPTEQLRRRTRHMQEEFNLAEAFLHSAIGQFLDMRSARVTWNGLSHGTVAKRGVFELSGSVFITHPMYPDTTYEVPSSIIGNETTGFFFSEFNRLKEEGDSLWVVFGENTDSSPEQDAKARAAGTVVLTQAKLRKGPTWVMIKETTLDLSGSGIVVGSDKIRVYPNPIGAPAFYVERTIRNIFKDENDDWFVEVAHDAPLWDQSTADHVPQTSAATKRSRASLGAEYTIVDSAGSTTRVAQRAFSTYHSNLEWFGAGRKDPLVPYAATANDYRGNEWQYAFPLCIVSNGALFFPLAAPAGIPAGASAVSITGMVRTAQADNITASHVFKAIQYLFAASDTKMLSIETTSNPGTVGQGAVRLAVEEAHTDGLVTTPIHWASPARPSRLKGYGTADGHTHPFFELSEQGMYTSGGAFAGKENALRLRRLAEGGTYGPAALGTTYNTLLASQLPYILSTDNAGFYEKTQTMQMTSANLQALTGHGLLIDSLIDFAASGVFETMVGKHDFIIEGALALNKLYPCIYDSETPGFVGGATAYRHSQSVPFSAVLRLSAGATATDPLSVALLYKTATPHVYSTVREAVDVATPTPAASHVYQETVVELLSTDSLEADGGNENASFPASPSSGSTLIFSSLFSMDRARFAGAGPYTYALTRKHSQFLVKLYAVPTYSGGRHRLSFYAQLEMHNEDADATLADRIQKNMYSQNYEGIYAGSPMAGVDPTLSVRLGINHVPRWAPVT